MLHSPYFFLGRTPAYLALDRVRFHSRGNDDLPDILDRAPKVNLQPLERACYFRGINVAPLVPRDPVKHIARSMGLWEGKLFGEITSRDYGIMYADVLRALIWNSNVEQMSPLGSWIEDAAADQASRDSAI